MDGRQILVHRSHIQFHSGHILLHSSRRTQPDAKCSIRAEATSFCQGDNAVIVAGRSGNTWEVVCVQEYEAERRRHVPKALPEDIQVIADIPSAYQDIILKPAPP